MSSRKRKQMNREIYNKCWFTYKFSNGYEPLAELCFDSIFDYYDYYGTFSKNHDTIDYSKAVTRDYKKTKK